MRAVGVRVRALPAASGLPPGGALTGGGALTRVTTDSFTLAAPRPGRYLARVRFTPYWALSGGGRGCVREAPGGWTELEASRAGSLHVVIDFALERVFGHGPRCR